ncbi:sigma-54 interaction domain-containing protein [Scandinavium manionii]|uniref:sigma-54 interaction domain-containing protein n=1 Tax=Scandinavium manionii TaxID=2926520 RepID=UPI001356E03E|nr:sigma-54 dependent transcriptional regulator [Scandinavium manionii]MCS2150681.1 sigma-54 dependent transcriptional regulator [Scandinavium manionii]MCS2166907.1 sigma-54 dependent transcriptional regulator [Scandinavium manionii]
MLDIIATDNRTLNVLTLAKKVAVFNVPVLIQGETGTGKEYIAKYIHANAFAECQDAPYIGVNCAAIPENMLESTLFGYEKGAFTGATHTVAGKLELANKGTLLLDEIGELPLALQAKLLRVLQENKVERLGGHRQIDLNFRLIACTNKNLEAEVAAGRFREDLFYRLNVVHIDVPPLRERREDIIPLATHFIQKYTSMLGRNVKLSESAKRSLATHQWPGNVRELENAIQRGMIMNRDGVVYPDMLGIPQTAPVSHAEPTLSETSVIASSAVSTVTAGQGDLRLHGRFAQYEYIADLMRTYQGNKSKIADLLGITPRALRYRLASMRKYGIEIFS